MPGNEFGERIHNFFGQEGLPQEQHQSQVVDGNWSGFGNGLVGNQRQIDPSLLANLKNFGAQQSVDPERGHSSNPQHSLNFNQQPVRSEYSRNLLQDHQQPTNGFMQGSRVFQGSPNEANFLGMNAESSRDRLSVRGFPPDLQKSPMRFSMGDAPVNYDFFGGQQQLNAQLPGMVQPFPRQQMTFNDMQLLKQQVMVKQMQEYQMQQQLQKQQLEARHINSLNSSAVHGSRQSDNQSHPLINGIPLQDASSNGWQPDHVTGNSNWMHRGISPVPQGSSSGLMITPEQVQANLMAPQFQPSLYGMPVSGTNAPLNAFSAVQMNRLPPQHGSANRSPSLTNQATGFLNQGDVQNSHMLPRSTYQEKQLFSNTSAPGSHDRINFESLQQDDSRERNILVQGRFGQIEGSTSSEKSRMKAPENVNALQKSTTLDPTEEKILFGSDDNLWDAFGNSTDMSLTGNLMSSNSDLFDACPSLQSGSWSALMQSAVAETSSDDPPVHEWGSKQETVWANNNNNNTVPHANSHLGNRSQDSGIKASNRQNKRVHSDSTGTAIQHSQDRGKKTSDHVSLEEPMGQRSHMAGNIFHSKSSGIDGQNNLFSARKNDGLEDRLGIWKAASNPNIAPLKEQKNPFTQNLQMQRESYDFGAASAGNDSRNVQGNIQQHLDNNSMEKAIPQLKSRDGSQILESYTSNNAGSNEMANVHDLSMFPGGKEAQLGNVGTRPSIPRKFQYHPMGNIDDPCREEVSHFGQSKSHGQPAMSMRSDKGHVSQNDLNYTNEQFKGMGSDNSPSTSASVDKSVDRQNQVKNASSRQTMLELLHKVDHSEERSLETNLSGNPEANISAEYGGQFRQPSSSQGFSLQLAPPSQPALSSDNVQFSQNSLQPLNSLHIAPEKGGTSQSRFAPWASNQSFPQQSHYQGPLSGTPGETNVNSGFPYTRGYQNHSLPVANNLVNSSSELSTPHTEEKDERSDFDQRKRSPQTPSLQNPTTHTYKGDSAEGFSMLSTSQPLVTSSQRSSSSGMMSETRAGIPAPQHRFWNQPSNPHPAFLRSHPLPTKNIEGSFSGQDMTNQRSSHNGSGRDMLNMHELQSKDMGAKQVPDATLMFSKTAKSNLQTFDCSLPSNNFQKDNIHHEDDLPKMNVQRLEDSGVDPQKIASKGQQQSPSRSDSLVRDGINHKESSNPMLHFGQTVSQSFSNKNHAASAETDRQQISPQMAPSWYSQYGTFKNGLVQPGNDSGRFTPMKIREQSSTTGNLVDGSQPVQMSEQRNIADPGYIVHMQQKSGSAPGAETPSSELLPHGATDQLLKVDKPKKRKTPTPGLISWNKEVMQGSQRLKTLSEAEVDWVRATNRFAEKVEFETLLEDISPIRSKRRLVYSTQLMQQLFRPPPAKVMSSDASSNYEFAAYTAARATLGDACSSTSTGRIESFSPPNNSIPLSERTKTEKISDQYISKAAEDFISRTGKLETDFAGLEKGTTVADLRVEVQDLEKFAVINRFARFHPSSSPMDRTTNSVKLNPQRYVTIAPMPQNIPDRVQCLAL